MVQTDHEEATTLQALERGRDIGDPSDREMQHRSRRGPQRGRRQRGGPSFPSDEHGGAGGLRGPTTRPEVLRVHDPVEHDDDGVFGEREGREAALVELSRRFDHRDHSLVVHDVEALDHVPLHPFDGDTGLSGSRGDLAHPFGAM